MSAENDMMLDLWLTRWPREATAVKVSASRSFVIKPADDDVY